ncbi:hypothetical protein HHI36_002506 [Cryptolaemus montrouzieri]|uniref:Uncharacterized protein n=1 Tax=Cryptolaemus montrouzieri TaxID=559131 RepID=A0ABD2PB72_9CUCU
MNKLALFFVTNVIPYLNAQFERRKHLSKAAVDETAVSSSLHLSISVSLSGQFKLEGVLDADFHQINGGGFQKPLPHKEGGKGLDLKDKSITPKKKKKKQELILVYGGGGNLCAGDNLPQSVCWEHEALCSVVSLDAVGLQQVDVNFTFSKCCFQILDSFLDFLDGGLFVQERGWRDCGKGLKGV